MPSDEELIKKAKEWMASKHETQLSDYLGMKYSEYLRWHNRMSRERKL